MSQRQRITIVGPGALGLAAALELGRRGHDVTMVDMLGPGTGTTGTTFAWLNANDKRPIEYNELNRDGMRAHVAFAEAAKGDWLAIDGNVEWAGGEEGVAELADPERAYVAVRHSGITLCLILGQVTADELEGSEQARLGIYRPSRFATTTTPAAD